MRWLTLLKNKWRDRTVNNEELILSVREISKALDQEIIAMQKSLKAHVLKVMRQKLSLEAD